MCSGAARSAHTSQLRLAFDVSGNSANATSVELELVRNGAAIWPKLTIAAIASPAAARLRGW